MGGLGRLRGVVLLIGFCVVFEISLNTKTELVLNIIINCLFGCLIVF